MNNKEPKWPRVIHDKEVARSLYIKYLECTPDKSSKEIIDMIADFLHVNDKTIYRHLYPIKQLLKDNNL